MTRPQCGLIALRAAGVVLALMLSAAEPAAAQVAASAGTESLWKRNQLLGDFGGLRGALEAAGVTLSLQETAEVLGDVSGGVRRGAVFEGALQMGLDIDTGKAIGLPDGTIHASAWQIHGRGLTANEVGNLNTISNIEATRATRLFELWYEQRLFDGAVSVRAGQLAADAEFQISAYAALFLNASFGWPVLAALDLPSGGPAYPLATPAVRLKVQASQDLALLFGVFSGDTAPAGTGDPQRRNASGTSFVLNRGVFVIGEVQYSLELGSAGAGLPGTYKIGAWYNSNAFPDQRYGSDGLSLANPASNGVPRSHRGNASLYAVADQTMWRQPATKDQGIGVFGRVTGTSDDRNLVTVAVNAGLTWKGVIPARGDDTLGLGITYTRIGASARGLDADAAFYAGGFAPVRNAETVVELTYQAPVTPWLTLQPDAQYVFSPAGGVPNPAAPTRRIGDAAVFGLRSVVIF